MSDRHGRIPREQQTRHRFADDIRPADYDGAEARQVRPQMIFDHQHAACGRTGHKRVRRVAGRELANVDVMKAVDVFRRCNRLRNPLFVQVIGQRQLNEDAVDCLILVERLHEIEHIFL